MEVTVMVSSMEFPQVFASSCYEIVVSIAILHLQYLFDSFLGIILNDCEGWIYCYLR